MTDGTSALGHGWKTVMQTAAKTTNAEAKRVAWSRPLADLIDRLGGEAEV